MLCTVDSVKANAVHICGDLMLIDLYWCWYSVLCCLLPCIQSAVTPLVLVIILVDLGNKLGIGQDKDASRSSMLFVEFNFVASD